MFYWDGGGQIHKTERNILKQTQEYDSDISNEDEMNGVGGNDYSFRKIINQIQTSNKFRRDLSLP